MARYFRYTDPKGVCPSFTAEWLEDGKAPENGTGISWQGWTWYRRTDNGQKCAMSFSPGEIVWLDNIDDVNSMNGNTGATDNGNGNANGLNDNTSAQDDEKPQPLIVVSQSDEKPTEATTTSQSEECSVIDLPEIGGIADSSTDNGQQTESQQTEVPDTTCSRKPRKRRKSESQRQRQIRRQQAQELAMLQQKAMETQRLQAERTQRNIEIFATVAAVVVVALVFFVGVGAIGLLAFFGAGGMLAKA